MFNEKRELADISADQTAESIAISWGANEPTAGISETIADGAGPDPIASDITLTWTTNEPTPATSETFADGFPPLAAVWDATLQSAMSDFLAGIYQYIANINAQLDNLNVDIAALRSAQVESFQFIADAKAQLDNLMTDAAVLKTKIDS